MKKHLTIVGPAASGKSELARLIAKNYKGPVAILPYRLFRKFYDNGGFYPSSITPKTRLIILEDLPAATPSEAIHEFQELPALRVNVRAGESYEITPKFILIQEDTVRFSSHTPPLISGSCSKDHEVIDLHRYTFEAIAPGVQRYL